MVAPIVAAAAPAVISSATDDKGLINQAFKLVVIIGLALSIGVGIYLIYSLTDILSSLSSGANLLSTIGSAIFNATPLGPVTSGITYLLSGAFVRNWKVLK